MNWLPCHHSNQQIVVVSFQDGTVQDLIERTLGEGRHIPELDILHMFKSLCDAILAFHSLDPPLAHRDIKVRQNCYEQWIVLLLKIISIPQSPRHGRFEPPSPSRKKFQFSLMHVVPTTALESPMCCSS